MHPVITFLFEREDEDFELTKYTLQAAFDGRLKKNEGFLSSVGDLATLTAAVGKDLYLSAAKMTFFVNTSVYQGIAQEAVLKVNDVIIETAKASLVRHTSAGAENVTESYEFKNLFHKVAPAQILKIQVITISATIDAEGFIQAIEVPTGENPVIFTGV